MKSILLSLFISLASCRCLDAFVVSPHLATGITNSLFTQMPKAPETRSTTTTTSDNRYGLNPSTASPSRLSLSAQDIIEAGVSFDTFAPQFLWLLMIAAPESEITEKIMKPITPILGLAAVHFIIVAVAASQEGALSQILLFQDVFTPELSQLQGIRKLFEIENFAAEEWPHVLIWDLFVGRAIWRDGVERGINTRISLSFCNFIGPPGLLIHAATCLLTGKGLPKV